MATTHTILFEEDQRALAGLCEELLQEGDDPAEFKLCYKCVLRTTPGADLSKIVDSGGRTFESQAPKPKKPHRVQRKFDNVYLPDQKCNR